MVWSNEIALVAAVTVLLLAGLAGWRLLRGRLTRRLLAGPHLLEVAEGLEPVKRAACRLLLASPAAFAPLPRDPRVLATSRGLLLHFTVSRDGSSYAHHLSLSVVGGYLPRPAGEALILFLVGLLGVPYEQLELTVSASSVHHAQFVLTETEHAELRQRSINPPRSAQLAGLRREWSLRREAMCWQPILHPEADTPGRRSFPGR